MTFSICATALRSTVASGLTALTLVVPAFAQQPATAPAPEPATVQVPPMTCTKPSDFMPTFRSSQELARFQKSLDVYKTCVNQYIQTNADKANELSAQARAYNDAANGAITNFNAYMGELNDASSKAKEDSSSPGQPRPKSKS